MSASDLASREERPAHVWFERVAIEDKAASLAAGRYVAKDVDYVNVTPAYSKDCFRSKVDSWLETVERDVQAGRTPERWMEHWKESYHRWQNGQEMPLTGTPIRGWGVISPAQQETLIRMNCLTVEDLADTNEEGMRRIGMGALDLRNKAKAWLATVADHGPVTIKMAELEKENANLTTQVGTLMEQVMALSSQVKAMQGPQGVIQGGYEAPADDNIGLSDILPDEEPVVGAQATKRVQRPRVPKE